MVTKLFLLYALYPTDYIDVLLYRGGSYLSKTGAIPHSAKSRPPLCLATAAAPWATTPYTCLTTDVTQTENRLNQPFG